MEDLRWTSRYFTHWNALNGFQCISVGFFISLDDDFVLQRFRWSGLMLSSEAPLYFMSDSPPPHSTMSELPYRKMQYGKWGQTCLCTQSPQLLLKKCLFCLTGFYWQHIIGNCRFPPSFFGHRCVLSLLSSL